MSTETATSRHRSLDMLCRFGGSRNAARRRAPSSGVYSVGIVESADSAMRYPSSDKPCSEGPETATSPRTRSAVIAIGDGLDYLSAGTLYGMAVRTVLTSLGAAALSLSAR